MLYRGLGGFTDATLPFVESAVAAGDPVMVAVSAAKIEALRERLGGRADRVSFVNMASVGQNPARIISAWRDFADAHAGRRLWGIGEPVWPERSAEELEECHRHECLLNTAFRDAGDFRLLCPYDAAALAPAVLGRVYQSHPEVIQDGRREASPSYSEDLDPFAGLLPEPPDDDTIQFRFEAETLPEVRRFVASASADAGLGPSQVEKMVLAVDELATNSTRHGGGSGTLETWQDDGRLVFEIRDRGRIRDPLTGRLRPSEDSYGGFGLWMANQLCEFVQVRSSDDGTVVRVHAGP